MCDNQSNDDMYTVMKCTKYRIYKAKSITTEMQEIKG
jgi:hypothetical protein